MSNLEVRGQRSEIRGQNGASGISDIEGKVPQARDERVGQRVSFKSEVRGQSLQRHSCRGFTLAEMLISVILLAFLVLFVSRLVNSAATITTLGNKRMDADSQARQLLDRMAIDFDQMLKRSDVSYWVKAANNTEPGNDQIAFFSAVPGYLASTQSSYQSNVGLVAYRVNRVNAASTSYNKVERMGKGLNLNGAYAGSITPLVFLDNAATPTTTILSIWPNATSATATDTDYEPIGPNVFRLEYYFLTSASPPTLVAYPTSSFKVPTLDWSTVDKINIKDVSAIVVAIAVIDPRSRVILTNPQVTNLIGLLPDYTTGMVPGQLLAAWQTALDGATPRQAIQGVRLYERYFYLNQ